MTAPLLLEGGLGILGAAAQTWYKQCSNHMFWSPQHARQPVSSTAILAQPIPLGKLSSMVGRSNNM